MSGFTGNYWIGFRQANQLGGMVLKGEKGVPIIVCCPSKRTKSNAATSEEEQRTTYYYKTDYVFNLYSQVTGIDFELEVSGHKTVDELDVLIDRTGALILHQGERAYYSLGEDFINMPLRSKFQTQDGYYQTLAHELIHYTKAEKEEKEKEKEEGNQNSFPDDCKQDYAVFIYDWLSRIAYKTKNHVTAVDFYQKIIDCLIKNPNDLKENKSIHLKPKLHEMVQHLQDNRDILNKREQKRIVVPLVVSIIAAIILDGFQIYSSLGEKENENTGILYERTKYCVQKIFTANIYPKEDIKVVLDKRKQPQELSISQKKKNESFITEEHLIKDLNKKPTLSCGDKNLVSCERVSKNPRTGFEVKVSYTNIKD